MSASVTDTRAPFLAHPWTRRLLTAHPNTVVRVPPSRNPKTTGEDSLFADILKSPRTIISCIAFYAEPPPITGGKEEGQNDDIVHEITTLFLLGPGLNGHPSILHGGIVATLLDESMGILQMLNAARSVERGANGFPGSFTAYLNVTYVKPVRTPGPVAVKAWFERREGRKEWVRAEVRQEGEGEGEEGEVVCARGEGLMVFAKGAKL